VTLRRQLTLNCGITIIYPTVEHAARRASTLNEPVSAASCNALP